MVIAELQEHPLPSNFHFSLDPIGWINALPSIAIPAVGAAGGYLALDKSNILRPGFSLGVTLAAFSNGYAWRSFASNVTATPGH
jgi:hypothetical protein